MKVKGIHHISNIVGHPQSNIDFNTSFLGLRMIKKAVNFDDAYTYHFYYGNYKADLGTIITAFPYAFDINEGIKGGGQVNSIYYIIPNNSIDFWEERLKLFNIEYAKVTKFNKTHLIFFDESGIQNELVEDESGITNDYEYNGITKNNAIKGFYGALIHSTKPEVTKDFFINILGMKLIDESQRFYRLEMDSLFAKYIDISKNTFNRGRNSKGTVHHIAFKVDSLDTLKLFKEKIESLGITVSNIRKRDFFDAIYFKEPGGTNIELSTLEPGFNINDIDDKASKLYLPEHFEEKRKELEDTLIPVYVKETNEIKTYKYKNKEEFEMYKYHQDLLTRLNELARISKNRTLTESELEERNNLREKYVLNIRKGFTSLIDTVKIEDEDGNLNKIERKKSIWN